MSTHPIDAAVLDRSGDHARPFVDSRPMRIARLDLDPPGSDELLIRMEAAGLCHSDLSVVNGDRVRPVPMALGHEGAGVVEQVGPGVEGFAPGDRVVLAFLPACGHCVACVSGNGYLCGRGAAANGRGEMLNGGFRLHECGRNVHHHLGISAFASHAVVDRRSAVKVPGDIPGEIAAVFGCAVLTGVGAAMNSACVRPGENVVVFGLGGVGLAALMGAMASGAANVIGVDPMAEKTALADELGASGVAPHGLAAALSDLMPEGPDVVIETVGKGQVLETAYRTARRGGRIVTVGLPAPDDLFSIPALSLVAEGKTVIGSYMGSAIPARDIPRYIALWQAGKLPVERLVSSTHRLSEINAMMERMAQGEGIRQIILFD
jgi:alcohol dehydrogenase